jgi:AraC family transcriptional regulator, positive regulator of tynA and feaB
MQRHDEHWCSTKIHASLYSREICSFFGCMSLNLDLDLNRRSRFYGEMWKVSAGDLAFFEVRSGPSRGGWHNDGRPKPKMETTALGLTYMREGSLHLRQASNDTNVREESIVLWTSAQPIEFNCDAPIDHLTLMLPYEPVAASLPGMHELVGTSIAAKGGLGGLLASHIISLRNEIQAVPPEHYGGIMRATIELFAATFRPQLQCVDSSTGRRALLRRAQEYIAANLVDPELNVASIADAMRVSQSYLHRLFKDVGMSVSDYIRKRRLNASKAALSRDVSRHLSIIEIAMHFGFCDASHFSRTFKDEFGLTPSAYRKQLRSSEPEHQQRA